MTFSGPFSLGSAETDFSLGLAADGGDYLNWTIRRLRTRKGEYATYQQCFGWRISKVDVPLKLLSIASTHVLARTIGKLLCLCLALCGYFSLESVHAGRIRSALAPRMLITCERRRDKQFVTIYQYLQSTSTSRHGRGESFLGRYASSKWLEKGSRCYFAR
ncbi:uncharacterized protein EI90DRAFT_2274852 [Cantharellus anzutake]|uniref:uncharacterized protein n=1 Tax=Cantharellus anzutake TaxID=1750568 RepID=UPI001907115D|nr:uncharacterized protein EI90DRAFT_2274852 [Cantharellus anzutake]KAF8339720.1 hypothetical protein EI90DRAFT_2274852 [Cantharellus anzutake]